MVDFAPSICGITSQVGFIDPDPDIAGIGVILAFLVIGTLTMLLLSVRVVSIYWAEYEDGTWSPRHLIKPELNKYPDLAVRPGERWPNLNAAKDFLAETSEKLGKKVVALNSSIYGLGDTQFATGMAICVGIFTKKDITAYHYFVCDELAWLAYISSTSSLVAARGNINLMQESCCCVHADTTASTTERQRAEPRADYTIFDNTAFAKHLLRVLFMWCLFGLVVAVEVNSNDAIGFAEETFSNGPHWDLSGDGSRATVFLIVFNFLSNIVDTITLIPTWGVLMAYYVKWMMEISTLPPLKTTNWPSSSGTKGPQRETPRTFYDLGKCAISDLLIITIRLPLRIVVLALYLFFFELVTAHIMNCGFFIWSALGVFMWRRLGRQCMMPDDRAEEDKYGFGQVMALTLVVSPLISTADVWFDVVGTTLKTRRSHRINTMKAIATSGRDDQHTQSSIDRPSSAEVAVKVSNSQITLPASDSVLNVSTESKFRHQD